MSRISKRPPLPADLAEGYLSQPSILGRQLVFVCEDDLWRVPTGGGEAVRLTTSLSRTATPCLSPDGRWIAFRAADEGPEEIYVMPARGGEARRLTYFGASCTVAGWSPEGDIIFASLHGQGLGHVYSLYRVAPEGGLPEKLPYGLVNSIAYGPGGRVALGRFTYDSARWKRYRGGMVGVLWVDAQGDGGFRKLDKLPGNICGPMWVGERLYFLSDALGTANLASCTDRGTDLRWHTHHTEFYARRCRTDGQRITYQCGARLYIYDPAKDSTEQVPIRLRSTHAQRQRKYVAPGEFLESYDLHPEGHSLAVVARGQSFYFGNWEGVVRRLPTAAGSRSRLTAWTADGQHLVTVSDEGGYEMVRLHALADPANPKVIEGWDLGRLTDLVPSPRADLPLVAAINQRHQLFVINTATAEAHMLDSSEHGVLDGVVWSVCGNWLAYSVARSASTAGIAAYHGPSGTQHQLTDGQFYDRCPSWDPAGKFLYFLSYRDFRPMYDSLYFDLNFPFPVVPCLLSLQAETPNPFLDYPQLRPEPASRAAATASPGWAGAERVSSGESAPLAEAPGPEVGAGSAPAEPTAEPPRAEPETPSAGSNTTEVRIDFEGIYRRVLAFPVAQRNYTGIVGLRGRVLLHHTRPTPGYEQPWSAPRQPSQGFLEIWDFKKMRADALMSGVGTWMALPEKDTIAYGQGRHIRVATIDQLLGTTKFEDAGARNDGWIALDRIRLQVTPMEEWRQMFREVWRLQREDFFAGHLPQPDWERIFAQYEPLLERIGTRSELSDLFWELQGELGTSHAYEMGGDYRSSPNYAQGHLGADFAWDGGAGGYRITHILRGDYWLEDADSPLNALGAGIREGDYLMGINGQRLGQYVTPQELLLFQAHQEVELTVLGAGHAQLPGEERAAQERRVTVQALGNEWMPRYRDWVEHNRAEVRRLSKGRLGYLHVPNMSAWGYAEFHRYYARECEHDGLVVDVRYNGGGHVSQLLLEKLSRKRLGHTVSRYRQPQPYPGESPRGPLVLLTNEIAGSDGDIFTHCWKMMGLGPVIGKRTWGGVIGIAPYHYLADGSMTTQPSYHYWFTNAGFGVENDGVEPDHTVEISPGEYHLGKDRQLEKAVRELLKALGESEVVKAHKEVARHASLPEGPTDPQPDRTQRDTLKQATAANTSKPSQNQSKTMPAAKSAAKTTKAPAAKAPTKAKAPAKKAAPAKAAAKPAAASKAKKVVKADVSPGTKAVKPAAKASKAKAPAPKAKAKATATAKAAPAKKVATVSAKAAAPAKPKAKAAPAKAAAKPAVAAKKAAAAPAKAPAAKKAAAPAKKKK